MFHLVYDDYVTGIRYCHGVRTTIGEAAQYSKSHQSKTGMVIDVIGEQCKCHEGTKSTKNFSLVVTREQQEEWKKQNLVKTTIGEVPELIKQTEKNVSATSDDENCATLEREVLNWIATNEINFDLCWIIGLKLAKSKDFKLIKCIERIITHPLNDTKEKIVRAEFACSKYLVYYYEVILPVQRQLPNFETPKAIMERQIEKIESITKN